MKIRRIVFAVGAVCALTVVAGCQGTPKDESTPAVTSSTPTPTETAPAWQANYSPDEIAAYKGALKRWDSYKLATEPIWTEGQATLAAKKVFQKYLIPWSYYWALLQSYEDQDIRIKGSGDVLDSKPVKINLSGSSASVTIQQCVDGSGVQGTQGTKELARPFDRPQVLKVELSKGESTQNAWLVTEITQSDKSQPCTAP